MPTIHVGHGAYSGTNRHASHESYRSALIDLLKRGVPMGPAQQALRSALAGSHATARARRGAMDVIEVVAVYHARLHLCECWSFYCDGRTYVMRLAEFRHLQMATKLACPTHTDMLRMARKLGYRFDLDRHLSVTHIIPSSTEET